MIESKFYEFRVIAFLDILGFSNLVKESTNNYILQKKLENIIKHIHSVKVRNYECSFKDVDSINKITKCEISNFSDSFIISYPLCKQFGGGVFQLIQDCLFLQLELAKTGIYLRGGITHGELYHKDDICFGPALIDAYHMESNDAIYPRIIIDSNTLEISSSYPYGNNSKNFEKNMINTLVTKFNDDKFFIDFIRQYDEFNSNKEYQEFIYLLYSDIKYNMSNSVGRVEEKYKWLLEYIDSIFIEK